MSADDHAADLRNVDIASLLPHTAPMILLDRVLEAAGETLRAEVRIQPASPFCSNGAVPGWVGIDYMAQAVAAWAGWRARRAGGAPAIGFLLGTRRYDAHVGAFAVGSALQVMVEREFQADNGLARFRCEIRCGDALWAAASISVFEPPVAAG